MNQFGVIAFCGSKGAGKSTSATLFQEIVGLETEELALAGHLKVVCAEVFGVDQSFFVDPKLKEVELDTFIVLTASNLEATLKAFHVDGIDYNVHIRPHIGRVLPTPRKLLQYIGTEVLHPIDPLIHVKIALRNKNPEKLTMITDLRFLNEFEYMKNTLGLQFLPVYVRNVKAEAVASLDAHPSERQLDLFKTSCRLMENEGTMADLRTKLQTLVNEISRVEAEVNVAS
jgi:hypothetical protein